MKTYFKKEFVHLTYDEEQRLGKAVWNGFLNSQEFKEASETCLNLIEEHQILYWLADNRKMKAIRPADQNWFAQEIIPRLVRTPLVKMATLVSEDIFNQMAVSSLEQKANEVVHFDSFHFKSEEEAMQWLRESALEKSY